MNIQDPEVKRGPMKLLFLAVMSVLPLLASAEQTFWLPQINLVPVERYYYRADGGFPYCRIDVSRNNGGNIDRINTWVRVLEAQETKQRLGFSRSIPGSSAVRMHTAMQHGPDFQAFKNHCWLMTSGLPADVADFMSALNEP